MIKTSSGKWPLKWRETIICGKVAFHFIAIFVGFRNIGQVADNVCDGIHDALSRPVYDVRVAVQLRHEGFLHRLVVRHNIPDVFQVPRDVRPQPRLIPGGVPCGADGWTCCSRQP